MPRPTLRMGRVPVSTTAQPSSQQGSDRGPVGLNRRHEDSLISYLQAHYGWHLGEDGNLYSPQPAITASSHRG